MEHLALESSPLTPAADVIQSVGVFTPAQNPSEASGILEQSSALSIFSMVVVYAEPLGVLSCLCDLNEVWDNGGIHLKSV